MRGHLNDHHRNQGRPFHWIVRLNLPGIALAMPGLFLAGTKYFGRVP
jgi:hypothetical protein